MPGLAHQADDRVQQLSSSRWYWLENFASGDVRQSSGATTSTRFRWGLGLDTHPITVMSLGGRFTPGDETMPTLPIHRPFLCKWAGHKVLVTFEFRHWYYQHEANMRDKYPFVAENQCVGRSSSAAKAT